jgi:hypothetical protein
VTPRQLGWWFLLGAIILVAIVVPIILAVTSQCEGCRVRFIP